MILSARCANTELLTLSPSDNESYAVRHPHIKGAVPKPGLHLFHPYAPFAALTALIRRTLCLIRNLCIVAGNGDLFRRTLPALIVNAGYRLALHIERTAGRLILIFAAALYPLVKAGTACLTGLFRLSPVYKNRSLTAKAVIVVHTSFCTAYQIGHDTFLLFRSRRKYVQNLVFYSAKNAAGFFLPHFFINLFCQLNAFICFLQQFHGFPWCGFPGR